MDTTSFPLGPTDPSTQVSTKAGALQWVLNVTEEIGADLTAAVIKELLKVQVTCLHRL
jgi:hypothetical protein